MRRILTTGITLAVLIACAPGGDDARGVDTSAATATPAPAGGEWVAAPGLPAGAQMMVVAGDPAQSGEFTVQLRFPDDYRVLPHTHPAAETVTVVSGVLHLGRGTTFDMSNVQELRAGQNVDLPANDPHFAHAAGETIIEVRSTGPFAINYPNPADAPPAP